MTARRLVVLDIGSTIVQGSPGHPARRIGTALGMSAVQRRALNHALMTRPFTRPEEASAFVRDELGVDNDAVDDVVAKVWSEQEGEAFPADGAESALTMLQAHGYQLALLSNIWQPYLTSTWRHFGMFFERHIPPPLQVVSFRVQMMKPTHDMFHRVLRAGSVSAADAVMVGDSYETDLRPAMQVGMKAMWVLQRPEREVESLVSILNTQAQAPSLAVPSIGSVTVDMVDALWDAKWTASARKGQG